MARLAKGHEHLETAIQSAAMAKTIGELRMAQALLMPLQFGLSLDDTSVALGISKSWVVRLRKRYACLESGTEQPKTKKGMRNRARMSLAEEAALLAPFIEQASQGGVIIVPPLKAKLEEKLGRTIGQTTVYTLLHRHGWRKLAPDKQHPKSDPAAQEEWKKTARTPSLRRKNLSATRPIKSHVRTARALVESPTRATAGVQNRCAHWSKRW